MLQIPFPLLPEGAKPINDHIAIFHEEGEVTFLNASCGIFKCSENDQYGMRLAQAFFVRQGVGARRQERWLNRSDICRNKVAYEQAVAVDR
jgi:hypothetical protein